MKLKRKKQGMTPLIRATEKVYREIVRELFVRELIERGVDINTRTNCQRRRDKEI